MYLNFASIIEDYDEFAYSHFADSETHLIPLSLHYDFLFFQPTDSHLYALVYICTVQD
jgi:hypothetical protein